MTIEISPGITSTPGVVGGEPCLAGTRIPPWVIRSRFVAGESIAEIVEDMQVSIAQVETALLYEGWLRHRAAAKRKLREAGL